MFASSRQRRRWGVLLPLATVVSLSACGDDDESAGTCGARDDLQEALTELAEVNVLRGGTDEVDEASDEVDDALDDLRSSAEDTYGDDVDQVESTLDQLTNAVSDDASSTDITDALSDLASAVNDLLSKVAEEC